MSLGFEIGLEQLGHLGLVVDHENPSRLACGKRLSSRGAGLRQGRPPRAQKRRDARRKGLFADGLRNEPVATRRQGPLPIPLHGMGRDGEDRDRRRRRIGANLARRLPSGDDGQREIHHDQFGTVPRGAHGRASIGDALDLVSLRLEKHLNECADIRRILRDQDPSHRLCLSVRPARSRSVGLRGSPPAGLPASAGSCPSPFAGSSERIR